MEIALQVKDVRLVEDRVYEIAKVTGSKNKGVALALLIEEAQLQMRNGIYLPFRLQEERRDCQGGVRDFGQGCTTCDLGGNGHLSRMLGMLLLPRCRQGRSEKLPVGKSDNGAFIMTANFREKFGASP